MTHLPWPETRLRPHRLAYVLIAGLALALALPATASATNLMYCAGATPKSAEPDAEAEDLTFTFRCSEPITGFTLTTARETAGFEPEVLVTTAEGAPVPGESFSCEGSLPGFGFACFGKASEVKTIQGAFHTTTPVCEGKRKLLPRLVVTDSDKRISEPFALSGPECPKPRKKSRKQRKQRKEQR